MQCRNCSFENMPGLNACARCQSVLALSEVAVAPRRASLWRVRTRLIQVWHGTRSSLPNLARLLPRWRPLVMHTISWRAVAWTIIPGLGHMREHDRRIGRTLLSIWSAMLLLALLTFPSGWSRWFMALAIAIHATAFVSLFAANLSYHRLIARALFGLLLFFCLSFFVYRPVGWSLRRFVVPLSVPALLAGDTIASDDGLLYQGAWMRSDTFSRGDLVAYRIAGRSGIGYIIREGVGLDRIVGGPGDYIQIRDGALLVNGEPPPSGQMPLGNLPRTGDFDMRLGADEYAIFPTRLPLNLGERRAFNSNIFRQISAINSEMIHGRVIFRLRPWSRFGFVE